MSDSLQCYDFWVLISGCPKEAYTLFYKLSKRGSLVDGNVASKLKINVVLSKLISELCKEGNIERASKAFKALLEMNVTPDKISYNQIIAGYSQVKDMEKARAFFDDLAERGVSPDIVLYTTLINGYWKDHYKQEACKLFTEMLQRGIEPDVTAFTVMLDGYLKDILHKYRLGIDLETRKKEFSGGSSSVLDQLKDWQLEPDVVFYTVLIDVYSKVDNVQGAQQHFDEMIRRGLTPDAFSYTALINAYITWGKETEAVNLLNEMLHKGVRPDTCILASLFVKLKSKMVRV